MNPNDNANGTRARAASLLDSLQMEFDLASDTASMRAAPAPHAAVGGLFEEDSVARGASNLFAQARADLVAQNAAFAQRLAQAAQATRAAQVNAGSGQSTGLPNLSDVVDVTAREVPPMTAQQGDHD